MSEVSYMHGKRPPVGSPGVQKGAWKKRGAGNESAASIARRMRALRQKNPAGRFTARHLEELRAEYERVRSVDPAGEAYHKLTRQLDTMTLTQLEQLAGARIKFVSALARNRVERRRVNPMAKGKRKKPRSAKQKAATRKLLAWNRAHRKSRAPAKRKRSSKRSSSRKRAHRSLRVQLKNRAGRWVTMCARATLPAATREARSLHRAFGAAARVVR